LPIPNKLLIALDPRQMASAPATRWLRRFGVTHVVLDEPFDGSGVDEIFHGEDLVLDELASQKPGVSNRRDWRVFRIHDGFPDVRLALRVREAPDLPSLIQGLSLRDGIDEAWYVSGEAPPGTAFSRADTARIIQWDGLTGRVEHSGAVELVLCRAHYPGWEVLINNDPPRPALRSNGGLLTACLDGRGTSTVAFRYRPTGLKIAVPVSGIAILACLGLIATTRTFTFRRRV
jgi:hypothetical protein